MNKIHLFLLFLCCVSSVFAGPRIVSLTPALTETVCFLDGEAALVGRSTACDYPEQVRKLPAAGDFAGLFPEQILKLKPDHIVTNDLTPKAKRQSKQLSLDIIVIPVKTIEDYIASLSVLGKILGKEKKAAEETVKAQKKLDELKRRAAQMKNRPSAIWVIWHKPVLIAGPGSFPNAVMELAGFRNEAAEVGEPYFKCSREWLAMKKPDYIIWTVSGVPFQPEGIWADFPRQTVLSELDHDILLRPGPRMFDGIEHLRQAREKAVRAQ